MRTRDGTRHHDRPAFTLVELCIALAITGTLLAIAVPRIALSTDRATTRGALQRLAAAYSLARSAALAHGAPATATLDPADRTITVVVAPADTVLRAATLGDPPLALSTTRAVINFGPTGLGFGPANTRVVARAGRAADTLFTSRLGRVRY